jgi:cysteine-rich repeat protein
MPHAYNWICNDFVCVEGTNDFSEDNCGPSEMLLSIRCVGAEECDLGAANSDAPGASCRTDCTVGGCGDGIVDPGETCDDGNSDNGDGCTAACGAPRCGDGVTSPGEGCDDGNDRDDDGCLAGCVRAACGDGSVNGAPEESPLESPRVASPAGITSYVCGEGATCPGGSCDVSGIPTAPEHGICQSFGFDRAVRATWTGIDGALNLTAARADHWVCEGYACATAPDADLSNTCSDGGMLSSIVCAGPTETCDLGVANSAAPGATCRPGCLLAGCGDGIVDPGEACDDGNGVDTDECTSSCTVAACGDGIRAFDGTEQCDDGNLVAGDGCDALCQREDACATLVISEDTFANNEGMLRFLGDYATESDFVLDPVGVTTSDAALLSRYAVVILNKSSRDFSRSDFDTLNNFAIRGGTLILAGSSLSNFGSDTLAPRLGRVNSAGFGPFGDLGRVEAVDDWALDGRRRFFETGADFVLNDFSHDQITSDPRLGSRTLVSIESAALLTVAPVRSGRVYVWNGNDGFGDWVNSLDSAAALLHIIDATCEQRSTGSR